MIEFDLNRALFLTYTGVGAAFLVLGALVIFTAIIGRWGNWRLRRMQARAEAAPSAAVAPRVETVAEAEPEGPDPELAAAIGAAIRLAQEAQRRENGADLAAGAADTYSNNGGWREQGRIVAFEGRRIRERDR